MKFQSILCYLRLYQAIQLQQELQLLKRKVGVGQILREEESSQNEELRTLLVQWFQLMRSEFEMFNKSVLSLCKTALL